MSESNRKRNWFFASGLGCVSLLVGVVGFIALLFAFIFGIFRSTDPYQMTVTTARQNPQLTQEIGTPMEEGWFPLGSVETSGASSYADLNIPVSGPKGSARVYVVATKVAGEWRYETMVARVKGSDRTIDLLANAPVKTET